MVTILEALINNNKDPYYSSISKKINIVNIDEKEWEKGINIIYDGFFCNYKNFSNIVLVKEWDYIPALCIKKIYSKYDNVNISRYSFWVTYDNNIFKKLIVRNNNFSLVSEYCS
jgi:hypothetical protein